MAFHKWAQQYHCIWASNYLVKQGLQIGPQVLRDSSILFRGAHLRAIQVAVQWDHQPWCHTAIHSTQLFKKPAAKEAVIRMPSLRSAIMFTSWFSSQQNTHTHTYLYCSEPTVRLCSVDSCITVTTPYEKEYLQQCSLANTGMTATDPIATLLTSTWCMINTIYRSNLKSQDNQLSLQWWKGRTRRVRFHYLGHWSASQEAQITLHCCRPVKIAVM